MVRKDGKAQNKSHKKNKQLTKKQYEYYQRKQGEVDGQNSGESIPDGDNVSIQDVQEPNDIDSNYTSNKDEDLNSTHDKREYGTTGIMDIDDERKVSCVTLGDVTNCGEEVIKETSNVQGNELKEGYFMDDVIEADAEDVTRSIGDEAGVPCHWKVISKEDEEKVTAESEHSKGKLNTVHMVHKGSIHYFL